MPLMDFLLDHSIVFALTPRPTQVFLCLESTILSFSKSLVQSNFDRLKLWELFVQVKTPSGNKINTSCDSKMNMSGVFVKDPYHNQYQCQGHNVKVKVTMSKVWVWLEKSLNTRNT